MRPLSERACHTIVALLQVEMILPPHVGRSLEDRGIAARTHPRHNRYRLTAWGRQLASAIRAEQVIHRAIAPLYDVEIRV